MQSKNSGYYGYSYSVRSHQARQASRLPMTLAKKELQTLLKQEGFNFTLKDCQLALEDMGNYGEWHHTGKYCNKTHHYNVAITFASIVYGGLHPGKIGYSETSTSFATWVEYEWGNEFTFEVLEEYLYAPKNPYYEAHTTIVSNSYFGLYAIIDGEKVSMTDRGTFIAELTGATRPDILDLRKDIIERSKTLAKTA